MNGKISYKKFLKNKTILVTGGSGSIGSILTKKLLEYPVNSVRILDVNENGLFRLKKIINDPRLRLLLGDIQDSERVEMAGHGTDIVIHLAAIKNIEISEYNPIETINTNISGIINLIKMAKKNKPKIFLNVSTDKAANPSTLYGSTKQIAERLITWSASEDTKFITARFGNVFESRGNVFSIWEEEIKNKKPISITNYLMERYFFHADEAVEFILKCLTIAKGGEIFVPKLKSYKIKALAKKFSKNHKIIGMRRGEKLKEILITEEEKKIAKVINNMWIIRPDKKFKD